MQHNIHLRIVTAPGYHETKPAIFQNGSKHVNEFSSVQLQVPTLFCFEACQKKVKSQEKLTG